MSKESPTRDIILVASPGTLPAREIVRAVAARHGLPVAYIYSERRSDRIVAARLEAYSCIATAFPEWSFPRIGKFFKRDHTTIMHGLKRHAGKKPLRNGSAGGQR